MQCPACGGTVIETECNGYASSLCCDTPILLIANWELFETLPSDLRQIAIDQDGIEHTKMVTCAADNARHFGEWKQEAEARWPHLFQVMKRATPH